MVRKIFHLDLDAFFCAVEELRHPELVGKPFAVGGRAESRGVIASCSYAARAYGIRSAMPTSKAMRLCPDLVLLSGRHSDYSAVSRKVMAILERYSPVIEQVSIDEAFMDLSDLQELPFELAKTIQATIQNELGLPCSLGGASNKLVAKMACDEGKRRHKGVGAPRAILIVPEGQEREFLAPLSVDKLLGIGPKSASHLEQYGIHTIGDLAGANEGLLVQLFGKYGHDLRLHAQGIDARVLETEHQTKSISQEVTFERDVRDVKVLDSTLRQLAGQVAYRLRREGFAATTVRIKVRWPDFSLQSRQFTLPQATDLDGVIESVAVDLFERLWDGRPVRLLGVGVSGLQEAAHQLSLFDHQGEKERQLLEAMDALRARFGEGVVKRGNALKGKRK